VNAERRSKSPLLLLLCGLCGVSVSLPGELRADPAPLGSSRPPMLPLPTPQDPRLPAPDAAALTRLDALLERLIAKDASVRFQARAELSRLDSDGLLPAMAVRLESIADQADKPAMKEKLAQLRDSARERLRLDSERRGDPALVVTPDYLDLLLRAEPSSERSYKALVHVLALSRMLEHIGSVAAVKQLIRVYVRFGEFLRVDTQLALARLGERAVAPLIETTRHPAPQIVSWAEERLLSMGKSLPSDAVQVSDTGVLSDILRAYGRARRLDTARLLISYAQSERAPVRQAARESLTLLGTASTWQLRDAYEKTLGKRAPEEWSWERTARELFAELDRQRLLDIYALFDSGRAAVERGELKAARDTFDRVLASDPGFQDGSLMAEAYIAFGRRYADEAPDEARLGLSRAERLVPEGPLHAQAESLRSTLDVEALLAEGIVDQVLLHRAAEQDPQNQRAASLLERLDQGNPNRASAWQRYRSVALIAVLGVIASAFLALRHRRRDRVAPLAASRGAEPPVTGG
jgi:hypothetical protein